MPTATGSASACNGTPRTKPPRRSTGRFSTASCSRRTRPPERSRGWPLRRDCMPTTRLIVGLSVSAGREGVDAALLQVEGIGLSARLQVVRAARFAFPADVRDSLLSQGSVNARAVGDALAVAARRILGHDGE